MIFKKFDRRSFLGMAGLTVAGCSTEAGRCASRDERIFEDLGRVRTEDLAPPFTLGVASGDPLFDRVMLWTRLAPRPTEGGGMPPEPVAVAWQVARDPDFDRIVSQGVIDALPEHAHAVHVDVVGLEPERTYYYRFSTAGHTSPVGRTRTLPCPDATPERFRVAWASCQKYREGYYTAHAALAQDDLDLVVFVGDYIYESGGDGIRATETEARRIESLEDYRNRYGLYKADPNLRAAHAAFPWVVTWDDHEVENDYAGSESVRGRGTDAFRALRTAAYRAFWEHMPIRAPAPTEDRLDLFRDFRIGTLGRLFVLDTRQYRSTPACGGDFGEVCGERDDEERTMLGPRQEAWLIDGLSSSEARWNLLAQSVVMADYDFGDTVANFDQWDGYTASRQRILDVARQGKNVVVLSGDIHASLVNDLTAIGSDPRSRIVATELVTPAITSSGSDLLADVLGGEPHVRFVDGTSHGYMRAELRADELEATLVTVESTSEPESSSGVTARFRVAVDQPGVIRTA